MVYRQFKILYHFVGFHNIMFGISIDLSLPNFEIHLPGGFIRIGICEVLEIGNVLEFSSLYKVEMENSERYLNSLRKDNAT